jgi:hypothetical protein
MANRKFVSHRLTCCDACGAEWFGVEGIAQSRSHADRTGHQVRVEYLVRETLNERPDWAGLHSDVPQVELTDKEKAQSKAAAEARLREDGVIA